MKKLTKAESNTLNELIKRAQANDQIIPYYANAVAQDVPEAVQPKPYNKYDRTVKDTDGNSVVVDVYSVLDGFNVTCPALQHLIKKALCVGIRGHKDTDQDLQDINASAIRAIQLNKNRNQGE